MTQKILVCIFMPHNCVWLRHKEAEVNIGLWALRLGEDVVLILLRL